MRRVAVVLAAIGLLALGLALPAPAAPGPCQAGDAQVNILNSSSSGFSPGTVTVPTGGVVCWTNQDSESHNATAFSGGNPNSGDLGAGGVYRSEPFPTDATISYRCTIHPNMTGTVKVGTGGSGGGGGGGGTGSDPPPTVDPAPRLSSVRVLPRRACGPRSPRCRRPGARVRFSLSERARVSGAIDRLGGGSSRVVRRFSVSSRAGVNRVRLPLRRLRPGRYRLALRARDGAGNRSAVVRAGFRLTR